MKIINFIVKPVNQSINIQTNRVLLPYFTEADVKLDLSFKSEMMPSVVGMPCVRITYDFAEDHFEVINLVCGSRREAQDAKHYFEQNLNKSVQEQLSFAVPFECLNFIEHEIFEDIGDGSPCSEITYYDLTNKKRYFAEETLSGFEANQITNFKHTFNFR